MDSRDRRARDREHDADRYRHAAALALDQLQWCVNYLHGIRKAEIARAVEHNRATIIRQSGLNR